MSMVAWTVTRLYSVHALGVNLDFHGEDMASTWREPGEDIFRLERNCQTFATFSATLSFAIGTNSSHFYTQQIQRTIAIA